MLRRLSLLALALALALQAASIRLYLTDGSYHNVREYQKLEDRVRYYSVERGDWEEIPLSLVDLKRTEEEMKQREEQRKQDTAAFEAEEKVERQQRREIEAIPYDTGVFQVSGKELKVVKQAEAKVISNKRRSILKAMSPIPIVSGKSTVEIDGLKSAYTVESTLPEFYIRLTTDERFGIAKLKPLKNSRLVETWNLIPVTKELVDEIDTVEVFKRQIVEGLYKVWPAKPLAPGEYCVYEYTEGKGNIQIWDFSVPAGVK